MGYLNIRSSAFNLGFAALAIGISSISVGHFFSPSIRVNTQSLLASVDVLFDETPRASRVYAVSPKILAIEVPAPRVNLGQQQPYIAQAGDVLNTSNGRTHVERGGIIIGALVGADQNTLYTYDKVEYTGFKLAAADSPASYLISSSGDRNYSVPALPTIVFRKTKPSAFAETAPDTPRQQERGYGNWQWPVKHTLYLTLPSPMEPGTRYEVTFPGLGLASTDYEYQPKRDRTEAIHVSHVGFRPDDPLKVGYLSTWMGNGGALDFPEGLPFQLINNQSQAPVYRGTAQKVRAEQQSEDPRGQDYTLTEVHRLDFSDFSQTGSYRLCVDTIGCSFPFEISSSVWQEAFFTAVRGFYHQRSGIAIGEPFTNFTRQRAFHPDDGVSVYQSNASLLEVDMGLGTASTFEQLLATKTEEIVPNAWGGYFDAGDWDRRAHHLAIPRGLLELHNLFPEHFQQVNLNLPESANSLPDIVDEALWTIDFFRRLQTPEGGVRGGIESADHPQHGETSWQESLPVMAYAPDVWTSYLYAGVAARAAHTLKRYDAQLAQTYEDSALQAMAYAETNYPEYVAANYPGELQHYVEDERNLAALELYRLTGNARWHNLFLATTIFSQANVDASI
ncbi:MAG: glycoside hydrolase family 9 protein [Cyanobacteria bacterium P01_D01_bin.105]